MSKTNQPEASKTAYQPLVLATNYDTDPALTSIELAALDYLANRPTKIGGWRKEIHQSLNRLLKPLLDVYNIDPRNAIGRRRTITRFMEETHFRGKAFWGWTQEEWLETICCSGRDFHLRHKDVGVSRHYMIAVNYLLCGSTNVQCYGEILARYLAPRVFGHAAVNLAIQTVHQTLLGWGYTHFFRTSWTNAVCIALIGNRSPRLEDLTFDYLLELRESSMPEYLKKHLFSISRALTGLGILNYPLPPQEVRYKVYKEKFSALTHVPSEWAKWCGRWRETSTKAPKTRQTTYYSLLVAGRWMAEVFPAARTPADWTRETATAYVAAVCRMKVGEFSSARTIEKAKIGKPLTARAKNHLLTGLRLFFRDCQQWEWIPYNFDPSRYLATPLSVRSQIGPDPRVIADDVWAKLLNAGLNLRAEDVPSLGRPNYKTENSWYPLEMIRAAIVVWLFAGLRSDEICRLRLGCVRFEQFESSASTLKSENKLVADNESDRQKDARICLLNLPVNKTGTEFTKPVDAAVGEAVLVWEKLRPLQPAGVDQKTGELVDFLFAYRGQRMAQQYLNETLIPLLCRKAGVPLKDARGNITSHRARSTIASQLCNAKEPMSLFEIQQWLGHKTADATMSYVKTSLTKLTESYRDAEYFKRNLRMIEILIDQEAIKSGAAAENGEAWKYYDLGHGYCTYDFFDQCPHRMACAKCSFYVSKESSRAQLLEAKTNLQRMLQEIPLRDDEAAAVTDGIEAVEKLIDKLIDVPTPEGLSPREIATKRKRQLPMLSK